MNEELSRMLKASDKGVNQASGVLSRLFRQILLDLNVGTAEWSSKMQRWLNDPQNGIPRDIKVQSNRRGNLNKELKRLKMSWNVFRKGLQFLGPLKIEFVVKLHWPFKRVSIHTLVLNDIYQNDEDESSDDDEGTTAMLVQDELVKIGKSSKASEDDDVSEIINRPMMSSAELQRSIEEQLTRIRAQFQKPNPPPPDNSKGVP